MKIAKPCGLCIDGACPISGKQCPATETKICPEFAGDECMSSGREEESYEPLLKPTNSARL